MLNFGPWKRLESLPKLSLVVSALAGCGMVVVDNFRIWLTSDFGVSLRTFSNYWEKHSNRRIRFSLRGQSAGASEVFAAPLSRSDSNDVRLQNASCEKLMSRVRYSMDAIFRSPGTITSNELVPITYSSDILLSFSFFSEGSNSQLHLEQFDLSNWLNEKAVSVSDLRRSRVHCS